MVSTESTSGFWHPHRFSQMILAQTQISWFCSLQRHTAVAAHMTDELCNIQPCEIRWMVSGCSTACLKGLETRVLTPMQGIPWVSCLFFEPSQRIRPMSASNTLPLRLFGLGPRPSLFVDMPLLFLNWVL